MPRFDAVWNRFAQAGEHRFAALTVHIHHVGEHITALVLMSTAEFADTSFFRAFGYDFRRWPMAILLGFAALLFLSGAYVSRWTRRRWPPRRPGRTFLMPPPFSEDAEPPPDRRRFTFAALALVAVAVVAVGAATARRMDD